LSEFASWEQWVPAFAAFREKSGLTLSKFVPSDSAALHKESQELEPMLNRAQEHAAYAISFYYEAKNRNMDKLLQENWPKSSLDSTAKAQAFAELRGKELAERLVAVIESRRFTVSHALKLLEGK
jgi:hypothetical protein